MRTRLLRLGLAAVLPLVLAPLTNLPAAHADEDEGVGFWRNMPPEFAKRQIVGAPIGQLEDDKTIDPSTNGGTVSFNPTNMETKCTAVRADGDAPKSASGSANYIQPYQWFPGFNEGGPPTDFFRIDRTKGGECKASPLRDPLNTTASEQPGKAEATSSGTGSSNNESADTLHTESEDPERDVVVSVAYTGDRVEQHVATSASASVSSKGVVNSAQPGNQPGGLGGPPPPPFQPTTTTYLNKGCSAEGRAYWKFTRGIPCNPPTP